MAIYRKTCRRYNDLGHAHSLTFSCFHRQPLLSKSRTCGWLADAILLARQRHAFHLWAYVFMPEHVHLLIWPTREYDISKILATIKQSVVRKAIPWLRLNAPDFLPRLLDQQPTGRRIYRFWQRGGGYDRNITEPTTIFAEIDYFHINPVRRGLCETAIDWLWSSAADHAGIRRGPLPLDVESLPRTPVG
jgi:putative transposase